MKVTCLIAKLVIEFDVQSKKLYNELKKYEVNLEPEFFIQSCLQDELSLPERKEDFKAKFYSLYNESDHLLQAQFGENDNLIGFIEYYEKKAILRFNRKNIFYDEFLLSDYALVYFVLKYQNAVFIHCSAFKYLDNGILLIATSGTGKSTHANLWSEYEDIVRINDDKNFILLEDGKLKIYSNPYSGKHLIHTNTVCDLTHLVFLHQSKENVARVLSKREEFILLLPHMVNTSFLIDKEKWNFMTDQLIKIPGISLGCNISQEAVETLKKVL